jgi:hypothetical protein
VHGRRQPVLGAGRLVLTVVLLGCSTTPPTPPSATPGTPDEAASATASAPEVRCTPDPDVTAPALRDPCPAAIEAVRTSVVVAGLPIEWLVVEPGPFFCDVIWSGAASERPCYGPAVRPGQYMRAWVGFVGSDEVGAVALGRNLPPDDELQDASPIPWHATLLAVEVPPAGWSEP